MFIFLLTKAQRPSIQISNFKLIINYNTANLFQFAKIIKTSQINKHKHKKKLCHKSYTPRLMYPQKNIDR